jgi:uncharacterized membrane protein YqjE
VLTNADALAILVGAMLATAIQVATARLADREAAPLFLTLSVALTAVLTLLALSPKIALAADVVVATVRRATVRIVFAIVAVNEAGHTGAAAVGKLAKI